MPRKRPLYTSSPQKNSRQRRETQTSKGKEKREELKNTGEGPEEKGGDDTRTSVDTRKKRKKRRRKKRISLVPRAPRISFSTDIGE